MYSFILHRVFLRFFNENAIIIDQTFIVLVLKEFMVESSGTK